MPTGRASRWMACLVPRPMTWCVGSRVPEGWRLTESQALTRGTLSVETVLGVGELGTLGTGHQVHRRVGLGVMRAGVLGRTPSGPRVHWDHPGRYRGGARSWEAERGNPMTDWLITYRDCLGLAVLAGGMLISYHTTAVTR